MAEHPPRIHLVTPALVERTVSRGGLPSVLTAAERVTFASFPTERRRRDWLAGRVAAKRAIRAIARVHGEPAPAYRSIELWNEPGGAPRFAVRGRPALGRRFDLSLAHSEGAAVAAVSDARVETVGVDLELTQPLAMTLVRRVLRPAELARLASSSERDLPSPLALWTAKEAALKAAHRDGGALHDVELTWGRRRSLAAHIVGAGRARRRILVRHRTVGPYTIAVALCR